MRPITASDVMNPRVLTVRHDVTVRELANFLVDNDISGAPVEDGSGKLVGVVSVTDIAEVLSEDDEEDDEDDSERSGFFVSEWDGRLRREEIDDIPLDATELTVADLMTPDVYTVTEETPVSEIAEAMIANHIHRLLVTREDRVVGIISTSDLLGLLVEDKE
jgi:CBS domain-containing protein